MTTHAATPAPRPEQLAREHHVVCRDLFKIYKIADLEVVALRGLDLSVGRGEVLAIVGASGSGKSTLLNVLAGLDVPSAGAAFVNQKDLLALGEEELVDYRREQVGFVWQQTGRNLIPYLSAQQNIEVPMILAGRTRGAWLLEPYTDSPDSAGLNTTPPESIAETANWAIANDFQLCVHAIGDRANRETLDIFQKTFEANPDKTDVRWRDEHTQHLHPDDIPRFGELGVIASMQGVHCTSDAPFVVPRLGEQRAEAGAYVWKSLMDAGAVVTNGTDAPTEDVSPIASYYATVSRKLADGSVFYPDQRLSRLEALQTYTINAAFAAFEDDIKGSLSVGKLADITVLSKDITTILEDEIPTTEVVHTIVGGRVMYSRSDQLTRR